MKEDIIALEQYLNAIDTFGTIDYKCITNLYEPIKNILSDHKRVLKENEKQQKLIDKMKKFLLKENRMCDFLESEEYMNEEVNSLKKENEELAYRCKKLDQEAQGYLEALAGDNTLTKRNIKQLQEENEELKADIEDYKSMLDMFDNRKYRKMYLEERRAEQPNLLYPDADEIYERYYKLKELNEQLESDLDNLKVPTGDYLLVAKRGTLNEDYIPKQKIRDKIEKYRKQRMKLASGDFWASERNINDDAVLFAGIEALKELLEEK